MCMWQRIAMQPWIFLCTWRCPNITAARINSLTSARLREPGKGPTVVPTRLHDTDSPDVPFEDRRLPRRRIRARRSQSTSQLLSKEDRSAAVVRAMAGVALCRIAALQDQDPGLQLPSTRTAFMQAMGLLRQAMDRAVASERLYWLVFNVSVHTFRCSSVLLRRGYGADTLPYLVHVVLCVENAVHLCLPRFLPWRVELYRLTVAAFVSAGALDKAKVHSHARR